MMNSWLLVGRESVLVSSAATFLNDGLIVCRAQASGRFCEGKQ
jgi:hypothetical protein